jgi:hypothetical protein
MYICIGSQTWVHSLLLFECSTESILQILLGEEDWTVSSVVSPQN